MGVILSDVRRLMCETCPFHDHCQGWDKAPYCINSGLEDLISTLDFRERDRSLFADKDPRSEDGILTEGDYSGSMFEYIVELYFFLSGIGYSFELSSIFHAISQLDGEFELECLLRSIAVHGHEELMRFPGDYLLFNTAYFHNRHLLHDIQNKKEQEILRFRETQEQYEKQLENLNRKRERERKQSGTEDLVEKAKRLEKEQEKTEGLNKALEKAPMLADFVAMIENLNIPEKKALLQEVKEASKTAVKLTNAKQIMDAIKKRMDLIEKARVAESAKPDLANIEKEIEALRSALIKEKERHEETLSGIIKDSSVNHRKQFGTRHSSVQSLSKGEAVVGKKFKQLTQEDKALVREYINENIRKFRTRLARQIRTDKNHRIDMPETVKKACATGGIPIRLSHIRPRREKANLILFLDVSGSCRDASELMLYFMGAIKDAFPGGCKTYAFTNTLHDISDYYQIKDPDVAIGRILNEIPSAGAYSNYEASFRMFHEEHLGEVNSETYLYFIGDARNNKNLPGLDHIKAIARKAKKAYWLNTEARPAWGTGDSIIYQYARYMNYVTEVLTPKQLISFVAG